jgi:hypothetical protein
MMGTQNDTMSQLQSLDLSGSSLEGSVPRWFWSCPILIFVHLSKNQFGGSIRSIGSFSSIQVLNLSTNRFANLIRLSVFPKLRIIDFSLKLTDISSFRQCPTHFVSSIIEAFRLVQCTTTSTVLSLPISLRLSNKSINGIFPSDFKRSEMKCSKCSC